MREFLEINKLCISCDSCRIVCPENAIITDGKEYSIDTWSCTMCNLCVAACPPNAIKLITEDLNKDQESTS